MLKVMQMIIDVYTIVNITVKIYLLNKKFDI